MTKKRILIVDDDVNAACLLKARLEKTGSYEVRTEANGTHVLATARQYKPQFILLDVNMPDMDGGEVAFRLQSDDALKQIPVVFLTSIISEEEAADRRGVGSFEFLAKPASAEKVIACIEKYLAQSAPATEVR